jgi:putative transposase
MPVSKHKPTTLSPECSTSESASASLPEQEEFRQHLRRLAVSAVQVLIEQVMREELEQCIGATWGECTPTRRGYRNGSYTRDLVTPTGRIEDLKVSRDRAGALTDMFVSGTSTHRVGKVAEKLLGVAPSASAVSRLNQALTEQYEAWRQRRLLPTIVSSTWMASILRCGMAAKPMRP